MPTPPVVVEQPVVEEERKLTDRQERFVVAFLGCANGAEAARTAGYSEKTAREMAYENLSKPHIALAIKRKRDQIMKDEESKVDWLISRLTAEATDGENGESTRVRALEILGKVYGAYAPEKTEVTQFDGAFLADLDSLPVEQEENPSEISDLH